MEHDNAVESASKLNPDEYLEAREKARQCLLERAKEHLIPSSNPARPQAWRCKHCPKLLDKLRETAVHIENSHLAEESAAYVCSFCVDKRGFSKYSGYVRHMLSYHKT